jgi:hypothetical protein
MPEYACYCGHCFPLRHWRAIQTLKDHLARDESALEFARRAAVPNSQFHHPLQNHVNLTKRAISDATRVGSGAPGDPSSTICSSRNCSESRGEFPTAVEANEHHQELDDEMETDSCDSNIDEEERLDYIELQLEAPNEQQGEMNLNDNLEDEDEDDSETSDMEEDEPLLAPSPLPTAEGPGQVPIHYSSIEEPEERSMWTSQVLHSSHWKDDPSSLLSSSIPSEEA